LLDHLEVAAECAYISANDSIGVRKMAEEMLALLNGYVKYLSNQKRLNKSKHNNSTTNPLNNLTILSSNYSPIILRNKVII